MFGVCGLLFLVKDEPQGQDFGHHLCGEHHHEHDLQLFLQYGEHEHHNEHDLQLFLQHGEHEHHE